MNMRDPSHYAMPCHTIKCPQTLTRFLGGLKDHKKKIFFLKITKKKISRTTRCTRFQKYHPRIILSLSIVRVRRKNFSFSKIPSAHHLIFKYRASKTQKFPNFCRTLLTVNISEMADKEKRLRKILSKKGWKGRLKSVATLEEAHMIIIEDGQSMTKNLLVDKDTYVRGLEEGYTFPEDRIHYLVPSNPRDVRNVVRSATTLSGIKKRFC